MLQVTKRITASADDAYARITSGDWALASLDSIMCLVGMINVGTYKSGGGFRFLSISIPKYASIRSAFLTLTSHGTDSNTVINTRITGEKSVAGSTFSTIADYQARRGTVCGGANNDNIFLSLQVQWSDIPAWTVDTAYDSPYITAIIQAIIDQAGWTGEAGGDTVVLYWDDHAAEGDQESAHYRRSRSFDQATESYRPLLTINYVYSVLTNDATSVQATLATLNGEVTSQKDGTADYIGFVWDTQSRSDPGDTVPGSSAYANDWTDYDAGGHSVGSFNHQITTLPLTDYYFRACVHDDSGWSYGREIHFITLSAGAEKSYSMDALLKALGIEKSYSMDAYLMKQQLESFAADVLLQALGLTKDYTVDALIAAITAKSYTIDALIEALGLTKDYTVNALIVARMAKSHTIDALIEALGLTKDYTVDALIEALGLTVTYDMDTRLRATETATWDMDVRLMKQLVATYGMDALLQAAGILTKSYMMDCLLKALGVSKGYDMDTVLKAVIAVDYDMDVVLASRPTASFLIDAIIQATLTETYSIDAVLMKQLEATYGMDALLQAILLSSHTIDAVLWARLAQAYDVDALLQRRLAQAYDVDALLLRRPSQAYGMDVIVGELFILKLWFTIREELRLSSTIREELKLKSLIQDELSLNSSIR